MQHGPSTPPTYPGSCKTCFSPKPVLIGQHPLWSLPTTVLDDLFSSLGGYFEIISYSLLLNFILTTPPTLQITLKLQCLISHAKTSFLVNCTGGTQGVQLLTDQIRAKYEQLDSGEFGSPGSQAFDAEACELANLLARVNQLCQRLNLPMPQELYRPMLVKHWRHFSDQNTGRQIWLGYGGCSFIAIDM